MYLQLTAHNHFKAFAAWSSGTLIIFITFPAPQKASSAAYSASSPYLAPTTFVTPFATPPPTAQTAPTTPSQRFAITPTPVFAPSFTVSQYGCSCIYFPLSDFSNLSPTSLATFLPKRKRLPTCYEVNVKTFAVVFFKSCRFSFVSLETYLSSFRSTFFEMYPPRLQNPFDSRSPVNLSPLLICLEAPIRMPSFSVLYYYYSLLSISTFFPLFSTFYSFKLSTFAYYLLYFSLLLFRQHFSPRHEQTASEFSLILMIH